MNYKLTRSGQGSLIPANEVAIGELVEDGGEVLMGTYDGLVSLSVPSRTWTFRQGRRSLPDSPPTFLARRLTPGESVTLTVTK
jgi:hypothetical protein